MFFFPLILGVASGVVGFLIGKHGKSSTTTTKTSSSTTKKTSPPPIPEHLIKPSSMAPMRRGPAHFGQPEAAPSAMRRGAAHFGLPVRQPTAAPSPGGNLAVPMPPEIKALVDKTIANQASPLELATGLRWQKKNYGPGFNPERSVFAEALRRQVDKPTADKLIAAA